MLHEQPLLKHSGIGSTGAKGSVRIKRRMTTGVNICRDNILLNKDIREVVVEEKCGDFEKDVDDFLGFTGPQCVFCETFLTDEPPCLCSHCELPN